METVYVVKNTTRSRLNRTQRRKSPGATRFKQYLFNGSVRLVRNQSTRVTESLVLQHLEELIDKSAKGYIQVCTPDGSPVDLKHLGLKALHGKLGDEIRVEEDEKITEKLEELQNESSQEEPVDEGQSEEPESVDEAKAEEGESSDEEQAPEAVAEETDGEKAEEPSPEVPGDEPVEEPSPEVVSDVQAVMDSMTKAAIVEKLKDAGVENPQGNKTALAEQLLALGKEKAE